MNSSRNIVSRGSSIGLLAVVLCLILSGCDMPEYAGWVSAYMPVFDPLGPVKTADKWIAEDQSWKAIILGFVLMIWGGAWWGDPDSGKKWIGRVVLVMGLYILFRSL